jgi:L-malate glycosyltransferase
VKRSKNIVQFICYSPRNYSGFDKYNLILARKLGCLGYESVFVFTDRILNNNLERDLKDNNVRTEFIPSSGKLRMIAGVFRVFMKYKPVIVHAHFENIVQLSSVLISVFFKSCCFISFHSLLSPYSVKEYRVHKGAVKATLLRFYYRLLILLSERVICVSKAVEEQFIGFSGKESRKVIRQYLGIEIRVRKEDKDKIRQRLSLPTEDILICNVSAYEYIKGIDILIMALNHFKNKYPGHKFICCHLGGVRSDSPENQKYIEDTKKLVIKSGLQDEFIWMGQRDDIPDILGGFDIYIHPSRREGLPVSAMEAAASRLPLIGSEAGGIPEIVRNGINGYLFNSEDYETLAYCLYIMITDKETRLKMSEESIRIAESEFNVDIQTNKMAELYLLFIRNKN